MRKIEFALASSLDNFIAPRMAGNRFVLLLGILVLSRKKLPHR
jgi:hypothetical protein